MARTMLFRSRVSTGASLLSFIAAPAYTLPVGMFWNPVTQMIEGTVMDTTYNLPAVTYASVSDGSMTTLNNAMAAAAAIADSVDRKIVYSGIYTGQLNLPARAGTGQIYLVSAAVNSGLFPKAPGHRAVPADFVSNIAILQDSVLNSGTVAVNAASGAKNYRIVGAEIRRNPAGTDECAELVRLGNGSMTFANQPNGIVLDRCYLHGTDAQQIRHVLSMQGRNQAVIDSWVVDGHEVGNDAQAIACWTGCGPLKITNNHLEGAGQNILLGGSPMSSLLNGVNIADVEIQNNHLFKPLAWADGRHVVKEILEIKHGVRVLVYGNVMENNWNLDQPGQQSVVWTNDGSGGGTKVPWTKTQDVTFRANRTINTGAWFAVDTNNWHDNEQGVACNRVELSYNLCELRGGESEQPRLLQIENEQDGFADLTIIHNTAVSYGGQQNYMILMEGSVRGARWNINDNILPLSAYGTRDGDGLQGIACWNAHAPLDYSFRKNLCYNNGTFNGSPEPATSTYPASLAAVGMISPSGFGGNYRLAASSPYRFQATDGTDPGANIDYVEAATANVTVGY